MAGTLLSGVSALGLKFADHVHRAFAESDFAKDQESYLDYRRFVVYARFTPERLMALPEPAQGPETVFWWHYARGEVYAARHDAAGVAREAAAMTGDAPIKDVARGVLAGRLAVLQGHYAQAAQDFEAAAAKQDAMIESFDPPPWWYPVRRSAAAAWLLDGQYAKAEEAATTSLQKWPDDPMALLVRSWAEDKEGRNLDARHDEASAIGNWQGDIAKVDVAVI
jgi:tetratricopeptide (TPR) repeat protein